MADGLRASFAAPLTSRLDFVQGTCEKIHFQNFLGQHPLQATHLVV